ncbi:DNA polymerase III subunit delta [Patescibacteria group bacterium]
MILFLHGDDSYRQHERLQFLQDAFRKKFDAKGLSVAAVDGADFNIDEFRKHTKSVGLFSQKRFVALRNLWELKKEQQEELLEELDGIDEDTIFCITAENPPRKNNKLFKRLLKADKVEEYNELNQGQVRSFIKQKAKEHGANIDAPAVEHLASCIGADLWRLSNEIKKLAGQTSQISTDVVAESVDKALDENIFHLTDALGARNPKQATQLLQQQFELGANEQYLLTMIARQISTLLKVKKTDGKGLKMHPYVIKKSLEQAKRFEEDQLLDLYWHLLEIDQQIKTRSTDARTLLDMFVVEACA